MIGRASWSLGVFRNTEGRLELANTHERCGWLPHGTCGGC
jgi:hypothetical protein